MANTPTPKERVEQLETQVKGLTARVLDLEHALSDLLAATEKGTSKPGYTLNCPSNTALTRIMERHYEVLIDEIPAEWKREGRDPYR